MAKVKRALFLTPYYELGAVKYEKDKNYPRTSQTDTCVLAGHATNVEVEMKQDVADEEQAAADAKLAAVNKSSREAEAAAARGGDAIPVKADKFDDMTVADLKDFLDKKKVDYPSGALRDDLLVLARAA